MEFKTFTRCVIFVAALASVTTLLTSSASAGVFRRLFRSNQCQQPTYYAQPSAPSATPQATAGQTSQYHSFSYEPGTAAATTPTGGTMTSAAAQTGSHYRGWMRYEGNHPVPNLFRGDRKVLGLQSN